MVLGGPLATSTCVRRCCKHYTRRPSSGQTDLETGLHPHGPCMPRHAAVAKCKPNGLSNIHAFQIFGHWANWWGERLALRQWRAATREKAWWVWGDEQWRAIAIHFYSPTCDNRFSHRDTLPLSSNLPTASPSSPPVALYIHPGRRRLLLWRHASICAASWLLLRLTHGSPSALPALRPRDANMLSSPANQALAANTHLEPPAVAGATTPR